MNWYFLRSKSSLESSKWEIDVVNFHIHKQRMIFDKPLDLLEVIEMIGRYMQKAVFFQGGVG